MGEQAHCSHARTVNTAAVSMTARAALTWVRVARVGGVGSARGRRGVGVGTAWGRRGVKVARGQGAHTAAATPSRW